jgi:hypothetical protein
LFRTQQKRSKLKKQTNRTTAAALHMLLLATMNDSADMNTAVVTSSTPSFVETINETSFERILDICLGICFVMTAFVAARRMMSSRLPATPVTADADSAGAETTVVTAFYSLILLTSVLRALWFLIPATVWQPSYTPTAGTYVYVRWSIRNV